jgi:hypothetical protein
VGFVSPSAAGQPQGGSAPAGGSADAQASSVGVVSPSAAGQPQGGSAPAGGSADAQASSVGVVSLGGNNFGVLFPWWDVMFGTANFQERYDATGVRDQVEQQRDYGRGFWQQQWLGIKRIFKQA